MNEIEQLLRQRPVTQRDFPQVKDLRRICEDLGATKRRRNIYTSGKHVGYVWEYSLPPP